MDGRNALHLGIIVVVSALLSAGLITCLRPLLVRYALARPNSRSSHKTPTPQGGGIAVVAATFAGILLARGMSSINGALLHQFWLLAAATTLLAVVGIIDDLKTISVLPRLALQFVAVGIVVALLPADARIVALVPWWLERAFILVGGVYFVNLVNFMDGIDWMSVAEVTTVAAGIILLGWLDAYSPLATVTASALAGSMLGFAPFNRPVAKLFLGDVGSQPIGLLLLWFLIELAARGHVAAAILLPMYYLADATLTLVRRLLACEKITQAHRSHFYQRALDHGWRVLDVVGRVFVINIMVAALAIMTVVVGSALFSFLAVAAGAASVAWLLSTLIHEKT